MTLITTLVLCSQQPGLQPFTEFTSQRRMAAAVDAFLAGLPRTTILERETGKHGVFWHARVLTRLWGFADDFFVRVSCEAGLHQSTVEMQVCAPCSRVGFLWFKGSDDTNWRAASSRLASTCARS